MFWVLFAEGEAKFKVSTYPIPISVVVGGGSFGLKPNIYISLKSIHYFASKPPKSGPESSRDEASMPPTRIPTFPLASWNSQNDASNLRSDHFTLLLETHR